MSNEPMDDAADARGDLAVWLDNYTAGRCDRAQIQTSFLEICRSNPEAPWDALALLDQYQRRGRVDATLARSLKSDIAQLVFGEFRVFLQLLQLIIAVSTIATDLHFHLFSVLLAHLDELLPPLFRERRKRDSDQFPVVRRRQAEI